ncbi:hypothetical protein [Wukongibacter sp. M2B1]|uniref:hypothetical protein n=1 Tax=Wukongibacter sp. M2B1 TaxID=3088895 RepID=UPI003D7A406F
MIHRDILNADRLDYSCIYVVRKTHLSSDEVGKHVKTLFVWHNLYDRYVPVSNATMIVAKMAELKLFLEQHLFEVGEHGMSVCNNLNSYYDAVQNLIKENPNAGMRVLLYTNWFSKLFHISI